MLSHKPINDYYCDSLNKHVKALTAVETACNDHVSLAEIVRIILPRLTINQLQSIQKLILKITISKS